MPDYLIGVAILFAVYGINAISLNLQVGVTGLINFGQVAFVGIGAYSVAILSQHSVPWPLGFLVGGIIAALAGAAVGRLGRTLASDYWAIATLALAELIRLIALNSDFTGGAQGLSNVPNLWSGLSGRSRDLAILLTVLVLLGIAYLIGRRLVDGQFGRVLRTIREHQDLAAALGHDVVSAKVRVMAISAAIAAVSGGFYAMYISFIGPSQLMPFETFLIFAMVVVGGQGSVLGALLGAALITLLYDSSRFLNDIINLSADQAASARVLVVGAVLLGFLLVRSRGIVPEKARIFHAAR
ncbi:branched-chain amino acid ABC transporter permease [Aeromicrobium sp. P5_D10]